MDITDPIYHGARDVLDDDHPMAWDSQYCVACGVMVHAFNNECMTGWLETHWGPVCFECFAIVEYRDDVPGPGSVGVMPPNPWVANYLGETLDTTIDKC